MYVIKRQERPIGQIPEQEQSMIAGIINIGILFGSAIGIALLLKPRKPKSIKKRRRLSAKAKPLPR